MNNKNYLSQIWFGRIYNDLTENQKKFIEEKLKEPIVVW